jgi:hypothetical protein
MNEKSMKIHENSMKISRACLKSKVRRGAATLSQALARSCLALSSRSFCGGALRVFVQDAVRAVGSCCGKRHVLGRGTSSAHSIQYHLRRCTTARTILKSQRRFQRRFLKLTPLHFPSALIPTAFGAVQREDFVGSLQEL